MQHAVGGVDKQGRDLRQPKPLAEHAKILANAPRTLTFCRVGKSSDTGPMVATILVNGGVVFQVYTDRLLPTNCG